MYGLPCGTGALAARLQNGCPGNGGLLISGDRAQAITHARLGKDNLIAGVQRPDNVTGTGLGLSISRGLVEAHGSRIWAQSRPGGGTLITVALPLLEAEEQERILCGLGYRLRAE